MILENNIGDVLSIVCDLTKNGDNGFDFFLTTQHKKSYNNILLSLGKLSACSVGFEDEYLQIQAQDKSTVMYGKIISNIIIDACTIFIT